MEMGLKGYKLLACLLITVAAGNCMAGLTDDVFFINPLGGSWNDANNWRSTDWADPNVGQVPCLPDPCDISVGCRGNIGSWREGGTNLGRLVIDYPLRCFSIAVGRGIRGYGIVDILPGADVVTNQILGADGGTADVIGIVNMYGGSFDSNSPTGWSRLARGGTFIWNHYGGNAKLKMNYWAAESASSRLYINVTGGFFEVKYLPVPTFGKVYINVSGDGTYKTDAWTDNVFPLGAGGTWFTLNGAGTLIVRGDWTSDPTVGGLVTSDYNLSARLWPLSSIFTEITTDACGVIEDGDFDKDCDVDFRDLAVFASQWLN